MASIQDLLPLVTEPREDLPSECKTWLDLSSNEHKAKVARAAIALANHGGGFIVMGFEEAGGRLQSIPCPAGIPPITQDDVNAIIRRFATSEFHCVMYWIEHPSTKVSHPVIAVPGTLTEPVMSKRDVVGEIGLHRCYVRKPGPRSEEPQTGEEWRALLSCCVQARREDLLESIRSILSGRATSESPEPSAKEQLREFCTSAYERWNEITAAVPPTSGSRFPKGYYEMGFALIGAKPANNLGELQDRLRQARRIKLTGWTPFLELNRPEWSPYPLERYVEAWVGRPVDGQSALNDGSHADFWRASLDGTLYTIRGYAEDALEGRAAGTLFDITLPVWRIGEGILFAHRVAETFEGAEALAIRCRYTGLDGRKLVSITGRREVMIDHTSRSNGIVLEAQTTIQQVKDNLVEVLHQLLTPLYERFDFMQLPASLVDHELQNMLRGRF